MKWYVRSLFPVALVALMMCGGAAEEEVAQTADRTVTTATGAPPSPEKIARAGETTAAAALTTTTTAGSVVQIDFTGAIATIIRTSGSRAVFIADGHHVSRLFIKKPTVVHDDATEAAKLLKDAFTGTGVTVGCGPNHCEISKLNGLVFQVVDADDRAIEPALDPGADFNAFVPSLTKEAGTFALDKNVDVFPPSGDFTTFFELNGGRLGARPYCRPVSLVVDGGTPGPKRDFAELVTLTGSTSGTAKLQFGTDGKTWKTVPLARATVLSLRFENDPDSTAEEQPHFHLHEKVAEGAVSKFPKIASTEKCGLGTAVGCGQSRYP